MIYVYAIAESDCPPPDETGIGGAPVRTITEGPLAAFYSEDPPRGAAAGERALWEHEAVVEALMDAGPVLPMRFGTVISEEDGLREVLLARGAEFWRALDRVRGHVELGLRVLETEPAKVPHGAAESGRAYLLDKLEQRRGATKIADDLHPSLAELAVASTRTLRPADGVVFSAAYLVEPGHVPEFERRTERLRRERGDVELVCTGPWPPYSFTTADGDD